MSARQLHGAHGRCSLHPRRAPLPLRLCRAAASRRMLLVQRGVPTTAAHGAAREKRGVGAEVGGSWEGTGAPPAPPPPCRTLQAGSIHSSAIRCRIGASPVSMDRSRRDEFSKASRRDKRALLEKIRRKTGGTPGTAPRPRPTTPGGWRPARQGGESRGAKPRSPHSVTAGGNSHGMGRGKGGA